MYRAARNFLLGTLSLAACLAIFSSAYGYEDSGNKNLPIFPKRSISDPNVILARDLLAITKRERNTTQLRSAAIENMTELMAIDTKRHLATADELLSKVDLLERQIKQKKVDALPTTSPRSRGFSNVINELRRGVRNLSNTIESDYQNLIHLSNEIARIEALLQSPIDTSTSGLAPVFPTDGDGDFEQLRPLYRSSNSLSPNPLVDTNSLRERLLAIKLILKTLESRQLLELEKTNVQLASLAKLHQDLTQVSSEYESLLQKRDSSLNQSRINQISVLAVFALIASIPLLFLLLSSYPTGFVNLILDARLVTEILSTGFLLVAVIILGSSRLIDGEGLSGLIGAIAAYVFTQKVGSRVQKHFAKKEELPSP